MVDFCACGSLMRDGVCTNKNCGLHKNSPAKKTGAVRVSEEKKVKLSSDAKSNYNRARRNSKCITYRIEELEKREGK